MGYGQVAGARMSDASACTTRTPWKRARRERAHVSARARPATLTLVRTRVVRW